MKIYKKLITLLITFLLLNTGIFFAKVRPINTQRDFEQNVAKARMVIVYFYNDKNKNLTRMYEDVSNYQPYNDADIVFLKVNAARKELLSLASLYGIDALPTFIFFYHGKRLIDTMGNFVKLTGIISGTDLRTCIDRYYGTEVKRYIAKKEVRNEQRLAEENESWKEYFYPRTINVPSYGPEERMLE
jgi:thioredoxin-like negative regulator of GroEL